MALKILLVEDHEFTRIGLKLSLEQLDGLTIVGEAADGQDGLEKTIALKPDVVLMDVEMPIMDGIESTKQIKEKAPDTKVVMLTSHKSDQTIFAALSSGANGYCLKNISPEQLSAVIAMVADGAVWLDPGIANRVLSAYSVTSTTTAAPVAEKASAPAASTAATAPTPRASRTSVTLSPRETEVLRLVADGLSNQKIAQRLGLGLETVKTHMRHIMEKLAVSDRTEAAVKAMKQGIM
ncbi:MAG TPA: response regulator transcription factor [Planktothrix sp.]|jgi:DNA-binding NarL/FixJ family response regulator